MRSDLDRSPGHQPLHRQIADLLRKQILEGELPPGAQLPPERDLEPVFGVQRDSIRRALALLKAEGWIDTRHGSGNYVREQAPAEAIELLLGIDEDERGIFMYRHPQNWGLLAPTRIVRETPPPDVAWRLGLEPGVRAVARDRIIGPAGGRPTQLATTWLPETLVFRYPRLGEADTGPTGFLGLLEAAGHRLRFMLTVASRMPLPDETSAFQLAQGESILRLIRTTYDGDTDQAVELTDYRLVGSRYEITVPLHDRRRPPPPPAEQDLRD
jgi:GntR family transcriptional regulator